MKYEIEENLLKVIVNYLATKPYAETFQLIAEIQKSIPTEIKQKNTTAPEEKKEEKKV